MLLNDTRNYLEKWRAMHTPSQEIMLLIFVVLSVKLFVPAQPTVYNDERLTLHFEQFLKQEVTELSEIKKKPWSCISEKSQSDAS